MPPQIFDKRTCIVCKESKDTDEFALIHDGVHRKRQCRRCFNVSRKATRNLGRESAQSKVRYHANLERFRAQARQWRMDNPQRAKDTQSRHNLTRWWSIKTEVIAAYGGCCACCGEDTIHFLCLDHVNLDGGEHRKTVKNAYIYKWARDNNYPDTLRVLCYDCNQVSWRNNGICIHEIIAHDLFWGNLKAA